MNTHVNHEATLNLRAVEPSEMAQVEGGAIWFAIFAIGVGLAAGNARAREDANIAKEEAAVVSALKQGGII